MVTVAIIAILAALVVPNYSEYVRRSTLNEAFSSLADLRVKLEQFYQNNRNYGNDSCGNDGNADRVSFAIPGKFTYTCALAGDGYVMTATGSAGAANGHTFTLDSSNAKGTTTFKGHAVTKPCWLIKGDEC
jgi:type IV pilus assembly protein PilE